MPTPSLAPRNLPHAGRDPWVWLLAGLALFLQLWTLGRIEGYLLADSVEYLDRAHDVARGGTLDPSTVRSFAFSALLVPIFWLTGLVGAPDVAAVTLARLLVMAAGLATLVTVYRAGRRRFGVVAGLVAGFAIAVNPTFLQFGVEPLSESVATLGVALALSCALRVRGGGEAPGANGSWPDGKAGLRTGLWLGFALLMGFKTIPIALVVLGGLLAVGRWRRRALWLAAAGAYALVALVQCVLDLLVYGRFGGSLGAYLIENVGGLVAGQLVKLHGLGVPGAYDAAVYIYENMSANEGGEVAATAGNVNEVIRSLTSETWYLETLTSDFLVLPLALGCGVALLVAFKRRRMAEWLLIAVVGLCLFLLSTKSAKSWRLVLPLLPAIALLAGVGVDTVCRWLRARLGLLGTAGLVVLSFWLVAAGLADGQTVLARTNLAQYGAWWHAAEELEALAEERGEAWTFASAYHWAVRFRAEEPLELVKLPHHMDRWGSLDADEREATLAAVEELDAFLAHLQILTQDPEILRRVNARFQIADIHFDFEAFEDLGPLYVLVRRDVALEPQGRRGPRTFFERLEGADPGAYQAALTGAHSVDFRRRQPDGSAWQMVLLGYEVETGLAQNQLAWLTLHWYIGDAAGRSFDVVARVTDRDDRSYDFNHELAAGAHPSDTLAPGTILAESMAIPVPLDPTLFGGPDLRGDAVPVKLWLALAEYDRAPVDATPDAPPGPKRLVGGLNPFQPSGALPIDRRGEGPGGISKAGYRWSADGLFQVGGFWLPVPDAARTD